MTHLLNWLKNKVHLSNYHDKYVRELCLKHFKEHELFDNNIISFDSISITLTDQLTNLYGYSFDGNGDGDFDGGFDIEEDIEPKTSLGLGFTWWNGGEGLNTSISTNYDYTMQGETNSTNLSVVIGFSL